VPDATLADAVRAGMVKINIATHLNRIFTAAVRDFISANPGVVDTRKYLGAARRAVEAEATRLLQLLALR
jgi:fructose-bisphosphate aldolase, class II